MDETETRNPYAKLARTADDLSFDGVTSFEGAVAVVLDAAQRILLSKRARRGTDNIVEQGLSGVLQRLASDKAARLRTLGRKILVWEVAQEGKLSVVPDIAPDDVTGLVDDLLDTINYSIIALALLHGVWTLPQYTEETEHA